MNILLKHDLKLNYKLLVKKMFRTMEALRTSNSVRIKMLILNFQFNIMVTLQADIFEFIEDFVRIIFESFDDFDIRVKSAAEMMNWFIQEQITVQKEAFKNAQPDVLREVLKCVEKTDNYQVKILVVEWVYLIDALPRSLLYNQVKLVFPKLLYLLHQNNYEVRSLVLRKLEKLCREVRLSQKPVSKVREVLDALCKFLNRHGQKKQKSVELFHLLKTVLESFEFCVGPERTDGLSKDEQEKVPDILRKVFHMCLNEFTPVFYVQRLRNQLNNQLKSILQTVDLKEQLKGMDEYLFTQYILYSAKHNVRDIYLLKEVSLMRSLMTRAKPVQNVPFFARIFLQILSNNKANYKKRRFKIFLIEKTPLMIKSLFRSEALISEFYKSVLELVLRPSKTYAITDEIKYCLLLTSVNSLSLVDIFDILAFRHAEPQMSSGFVLKFFLIMKKMITEDIRRRFLYDCFECPQEFLNLRNFTESPQDAMISFETEPHSSSQIYKLVGEDFGSQLKGGKSCTSPRNNMLSFSVMHRANSLLAKRSIFDVLLENPFSTLMLSVLFGCYHFALKLVRHLVFFYASSKPIGDQDEFIRELEKVFHHLLATLRIPRHFADYHLFKLVELGCVLIPQNSLFLLLKQRLKFMKKMQVRVRSDHQLRKEEELLSFDKYVKSRKFFAKAEGSVY